MKLCLSVVFVAFCLLKVCTAKTEVYKFHWSNKCIDPRTAWESPIILETCNKTKEQFSIKLVDNVAEIRESYQCLDYANKIVWLYPCHGQGRNQAWHYNPETHQLRHDTYKKCLAISPDQRTFLAEECDAANTRQKLKMSDLDESSDYDRIS